MEDKTDNLIKIMKETKMSPSEKAIMKNHVLSFMDAHPVHVAKPFSNFSSSLSHFSAVSFVKLLAIGIAVAGILVGAVYYKDTTDLPVIISPSPVIQNKIPTTGTGSHTQGTTGATGVKKKIKPKPGTSGTAAGSTTTSTTTNTGGTTDSSGASGAAGTGGAAGVPGTPTGLGTAGGQ